MTITKISFGLSLIIALCMSCATNQSQVSKPSNADFFINPTTKQTYVGRGAKFSIRSLDRNRFLEQIELSIDNEEFSPYREQIDLKSEGPHILRYRSVDPVGNQSPIKTVKIYADFSPPDIRPIWEGEHVIRDSRIFISKRTKLRFESRDRYAGVAKNLVKSSISSEVIEINRPMNFQSEGPRKIFAASVDQVGNQGDWQTIEFTVDNTPPKTEYELIGPHKANAKNIFISDETRLVLKASDQAAGVEMIEYRRDDGPLQVYRSAISLDADKTELSYRAVDQLGNEAAWQTLHLQRDLEKPNINVQAKGPHIEDRGIIYAQPGFKMQVKVSDQLSGVATVWVSTRKGGFVETKETLFSFDQPGIHHFIVRAEDAIGNRSESKPLSIFIDNTVDGSNLIAKRKLVPYEGVQLTSLPNSIDIIGNDHGVGIDYIEYGFDGKTFQALEGSINLEQWKSPQRTLYYRAVDRLGNKEPIKSLTIRIQTQSPLVDIFIDSSTKPDVPHSELLESKTGH